MQIGFHTDAFASTFFNFEECLDWAQKNDVHFIECGFVNGVSWLHGLGYFPHLSVIDDPYHIRRLQEKYDCRLSQIDAAFPLSEQTGVTFGVPYVLDTLRYAKLCGCPRVATTDGLHKPEGFTDSEAMEHMKKCYKMLVEKAEMYEIDLTIEIHGYFTTNIDRLQEMLEFSDSPRLCLNFDTGNSYIGGGDPVEFAKRFAKRISHVHIKDVSKELASSLRGNATGIALSHAAIGDGVNAENIRECLKILHSAGFNGTMSMEVEGQGGPMIEKSLRWLRATLAELGISEERKL